MKLETLLAQPKALPPAPKIAGKLIDTLDDPDADLETLAELIETDPVLTAKVIRQANSAFFGLLRSVSHPREAISMLGLTKVRAMALAALLQDGFHHAPGIDLELFWRYSLTTANLARYVAAPLGVDDSAVYTAGLIHGIGELVMHVGMPEAMAAGRRTGVTVSTCAVPRPKKPRLATTTLRWVQPLWRASGASPSAWWPGLRTICTRLTTTTSNPLLPWCTWQRGVRVWSFLTSSPVHSSVPIPMPWALPWVLTPMPS
jgi:hypothetical protein